VSGLLSGLLPQYYSLVLAHFVSDTEIGNYATALNFSTIALVIINPLNTALFPAFSKLSAAKNREPVERMLRLSVKYTSLVVVPTTVALALFSKELVFSLYGSSYGSAPLYLSIYTVSYLYAVLGSLVLPNLFTGQGDTRTPFKIGVVTFILSLLLAPALTSVMGVTGLLASILVSGLVSAILYLLFSRRVYGLSIGFSFSLRVLLSSILAVVPVLAIFIVVSVSNPFLRLAVGGTLYLGTYMLAAPLTGAFSVEDVANLRGMIDGIRVIRPVGHLVLRLEAGIAGLVSKQKGGLA
jgi:O-antigen/teichoic acid export membrane protein